MRKDHYSINRDFPLSTNGMNVLHIITQGVWGGAQRHVYDLAVQMKKKGIEVVVAHGAGDLLPQRLEEQGVRTVRIETLRRNISLLSEWESFRDLLEVIDDVKPDLIHAHSSKAGGLVSVAGITKGVPVVFTAHGWAFTQPRPLLYKAVYWLLSLFITLFSSRIIVVSDFVRRKTPFSFLFASKITVIRNAITCDTRPALPHPGIPPYDKLLISIAELHPTKGLDVLIRAMTLLPKSLGKVHLAIAGNGEQEDELKNLIERLHLGQNVTLLGFVKDAHLLLPHADLFVLPSRSEAFPYVMLEAGCAGIPVLGSNRGGIPELAPMTVPLTPQSLARGIEKLLTHEAMRQENADTLSQRVRTEFSLEKMVDRTFGVYQRIT
jgi:glycosyltransferase involved in cell wall biosynthesis